MAIALSAYRFGSEDGAESTHGWLAAANTALTREASNAGTFFVRGLVQATGTGQSNIDFQLQYSLNGGTFTNVTTTSSVVKAVATAIFANDANTTSRLGGTGTFESSSAGCSHDGLCGGTAFDIVTDGNGECLYSVQLVPASLVDGDTITFRLLADGATFTYSVTPTINVVVLPTITSVDGDNNTVDTRTGVTIVGTAMGASETGSAKVEISNNATYGSGTIVEIDATSWSATLVTVTLRRESDSAALATLFSLPLAPAYLWVTTSTGNRNTTGFEFTLHPPGPTAAAALNTSAALNVDTTYLVRVRVENTGAAGGTGFKWQANHASGGYADVTTSSNNVRAVAASSFVDNDDVPEVLGGSGSYAANNDAATEDGTTTLAANFPASGAVEYVLAFQLRSVDVSNGQTGLLRLVRDTGAALDVYTQTAQYTVVEAAAAKSLIFLSLAPSMRSMLVR